MKCEIVIVLRRKVASKKDGMIHVGPEMYHYGPLAKDSRTHLVVVLTRKVTLEKEGMIHFRLEMYRYGPLTDDSRTHCRPEM